MRSRLLVRLGSDDLASLDALNRRLWAWVESEYHHTSYLSHLLRLAGTEMPLFDEAAVEAVFQATNGLPRRVNRLAHHALNAAAAAKAKTVEAEHVETALPEVT